MMCVIGNRNRNRQCRHTCLIHAHSIRIHVCACASVHTYTHKIWPKSPHRTDSNAHAHDLLFLRIENHSKSRKSSTPFRTKTVLKNIWVHTQDFLVIPPHKWLFLHTQYDVCVHMHRRDGNFMRKQEAVVDISKSVHVAMAPDFMYLCIQWNYVCQRVNRQGNSLCHGYCQYNRHDGAHQTK